MISVGWITFARIFRGGPIAVLMDFFTGLFKVKEILLYPSALCVRSSASSFYPPQRTATNFDVDASSDLLHFYEHENLSINWVLATYQGIKITGCTAYQYVIMKNLSFRISDCDERCKETILVLSEKTETELSETFFKSEIIRNSWF